MPTPSNADLAITPESFFRSLETIGRQTRIPFSRSALEREFPPPYRLSAVQRAAGALGMRAELLSGSRKQIDSAQLPCFCVLRPENPSTPSDTEHDNRYGDDGLDSTQHSLDYVLSVNRDSVLLEGSGIAGVRTVSRAEFDSRYTGQTLRLLGEPVRPSEVEGGAEKRQFGFGWFARELLRYRGVWRDVLAASLAVQLLALVVPLLTQVIIDKVIVHRTMNTLLVVAAALVFAVVFTAVLSWIRQYLVLHTGTRIDAVLGAQVFEHLLRLPARYFERRPTGVLVARIHGVETIRDFLAGAALTLILDLPFMLVFAAIMFYYSPALTWIAIGILSMLMILSLAITPVLRRRVNQQFLAGARHQAFVTEYLAGIETVKSLQLEPRLNQRFGTLFSEYLAAGFSARQLASSFYAVAQCLEQLLAVSVLCVGAWLVMSGSDLTIGGLIAFQMFAARLAAPMLRIAGLWQEFQQVEVAVRRLGDVMNAPVEPYSLTAARSIDKQGALQCHELGFRYGPNRPWLFRRLSFLIEPGQCVALTGASGRGKSTVARLLQGFYAPAEGAILLDGIDACDMAANQLRSYFGVVPQETRLFAGTILQNVLDVDAQAGFEDAIEACKYAQVHTTIEALPEGYLSAIGENGIGLSGGQKQRIAIARALLKQPRILVFDEATSSLDAELSASLVDTINGLRGKISVLFIAHEVPPGLHTDAVVNLDQPCAGPQGVNDE